MCKWNGNFPLQAVGTEKLETSKGNPFLVISGISTTSMAIWFSTGLTGKFGYLESASNDLAEELALACNGVRSLAQFVVGITFLNSRLS